MAHTTSINAVSLYRLSLVIAETILSMSTVYLSILHGKWKWECLTTRIATLADMLTAVSINVFT